MHIDPVYSVTKDRSTLTGISPIGNSNGIFTRTEADARGRGGTVDVVAPLLRIQEGAVISARTSSDRPGGNVNIRGDRVIAQDGGQVISTTAAAGRAGDITLTIDGQVTLRGLDSTFANRLQDFGAQVIDNVGEGERSRLGRYLAKRSHSQPCHH